MTTSLEREQREVREQREARAASWRRERAATQERAMAPGRVAVTCSAPFGGGGLGRHLQELVDALARRGQPAGCICGSARSGGLLGRALALPVPLTPALRARLSAAEFDAYAARRLPDAEHLIAFNGQALAQFGAAARARYRSLALVSANSHMRRVIRQHELARAQYPLEGSWAAGMLARNLREYERADRVLFASRYIRDSFLEEGFPAERLVEFPLTPHPRYSPGERTADSDRFEIVYVGSLAVHKGVPLLIDAFRRLPQEDLRLTLVGGWASRGMRRFVQEACATDPRILAGPGDPLAHLRRASLCVHPAYEDGFGYAAAEALACGVPAIVSEDTGMKELIGTLGPGLVVPTGRLDALGEAIEAAYRGELFGHGRQA